MELKMLHGYTLVLVSILLNGKARADSCENGNCSVSIDIPLISKLNAPLKAELDITSLTEQLKELIQKEVKVAVSVEMKDLVENILDKRMQTALDSFEKSYNLTISTFIQKIEGNLMKDCNDINRTIHKSGVYHIYPNGAPGYKVYYDMDTDGGDGHSNYRLSFGTYSGSAENSLANKMKFTTADRQNDNRGKGGNCALDHYGGPWWYPYNCGGSDLNGEYVKGGKGLSSGKGVIWRGWKGFSYSMKVTKMMIRKT
ncbi:unnamed protein product [Mytilus coruscus]|uniref:Fibrinogen C-terminal domain-containing protein n=1 Tax=Mytilus coruscus TaxID=42192 RepID=A0A6J8BF48_MYTCO|nr:unnamed protein product [Mytilus coruscus]